MLLKKKKKKVNNIVFVFLGNFGEVSDEEEQREWVMTIIMLSLKYDY